MQAENQQAEVPLDAGQRPETRPYRWLLGTAAFVGILVGSVMLGIYGAKLWSHFVPDTEEPSDSTVAIDVPPDDEPESEQEPTPVQIILPPIADDQSTPTPVPGCSPLVAAPTLDQLVARWNDVLAGSCWAGSLDFGAVSPIRPDSETRVDETKRRFTLENGTGITLLLDAEGLVTRIEAGADTLPAVEQTSAVAVVALGSASAPAPNLLDLETRLCLGEPDYGRFDAWHAGIDPDFEVFVEICPDRSS